MNISIDQEALTELLNQVEDLKRQREELHDALSRKKEEERGIRFQVWQFHEKFGYPARQKVTPPTTEELRFRARLVMEEAFEFLAACVPESTKASVKVVQNVINKIVDEQVDADEFDMVEGVDALGDLDYVVEGTRLYWGVNGPEVAAEIHRANMAKEGGTFRGDGKIQKPPGWTPPDIRGILLNQGWSGD